MLNGMKSPYPRPSLNGINNYNNINNIPNTNKNQKANKDMHNRSYEGSINFDAYFDDVKFDIPSTTFTSSNKKKQKNKNPSNNISYSTQYNALCSNNISNNYNNNIDISSSKQNHTSVNKTRNINSNIKNNMSSSKGNRPKKEVMPSKLAELTFNSNNGNNTNNSLNNFSNGVQSYKPVVHAQNNSSCRTKINFNNKNTNNKLSTHQKTSSNFSINKDDLSNPTKNTSTSTYLGKNAISPSQDNTTSNNKEQDSPLHSSISLELLKLTFPNQLNNNMLNADTQDYRTHNNFEQEPLENFNQLKNDFNLLYTKDYLANIPNDLLKLELELLIEKMFEIVTCYHAQLDNVKFFYDKVNNLYKECYSKYLKLNNSYLELQQKKEEFQISKQNLNFIKNNICKQLQNIFNISNDEIKLFSGFIQDKTKNKNKKNLQLKNILYKALYENGNYMIIANDINDKQKEVIDNNFNVNKKQTLFSLNKSIEVPKIKGINTVFNKGNLNKMNNTTFNASLNMSIGSSRSIKDNNNIIKEKKKRVMTLKKSDNKRK
jgi:hypothetical protein